uniref:Lipoprotein n=1 Tax=Panagrellus redivivus TaxID=6233 RepID=A0A7E4VV00_PANRE
MLTIPWLLGSLLIPLLLAVILPVGCAGGKKKEPSEKPVPKPDRVTQSMVATAPPKSAVTGPTNTGTNSAAPPQE